MKRLLLFLGDIHFDGELRNTAVFAKDVVLLSALPLLHLVALSFFDSLIYDATVFDRQKLVRNMLRDTAHHPTASGSQEKPFAAFLSIGNGVRSSRKLSGPDSVRFIIEKDSPDLLPAP